jgi:hypothetical protein
VPGGRGARHENPECRASVSVRSLFSVFLFSSLLVRCLLSEQASPGRQTVDLTFKHASSRGYLAQLPTYSFVHVSIDTCTDAVGGVHGKGGSGNSQQAMGWLKSQNASRYLDIRIEGGEIPQSETIP